MTSNSHTNDLSPTFQQKSKRTAHCKMATSVIEHPCGYLWQGTLSLDPT